MTGGGSIHRHECLEGHHGPDEDEGADCPFCNRPKRLDTDASENCAMCGMAVNHIDEAAHIDGGSGRTLYFCSIWCLRIYRRTVMAAAHQAIEEVSVRRRKRTGDGADARTAS